MGGEKLPPCPPPVDETLTVPSVLYHLERIYEMPQHGWKKPTKRLTRMPTNEEGPGKCTSLLQLEIAWDTKSRCDTDSHGTY